MGGDPFHADFFTQHVQRFRKRGASAPQTPPKVQSLRSGIHVKKPRKWSISRANKTKHNKTKQNTTKQNKTKQNKAKQSKAKQSKAKQNKTKQNKTKQNKTKQN